VDRLIGDATGVDLSPETVQRAAKETLRRHEDGRRCGQCPPLHPDRCPQLRWGISVIAAFKEVYR
jgi:hypothetical protein